MQSYRHLNVYLSSQAILTETSLHTGSQTGSVTASGVFSFDESEQLGSGSDRKVFQEDHQMSGVGAFSRINPAHIWFFVHKSSLSSRTLWKMFDFPGLKQRFHSFSLLPRFSAQLASFDHVAAWNRTCSRLGLRRVQEESLLGGISCT